MKAVKQISTGRLVYRQDPDFEAGKGILCAKAMGFSEADLEEIEIIQADWEAELALKINNGKQAAFNIAIITALSKATLDKINALERNAGLLVTSLSEFETNIKAYL